MKKMKKHLALFVSFIMVFMLTVSAYADNSDLRNESEQIEISTPSNASLADGKEIASSGDVPAHSDSHDGDDEEESNHNFRPASGSNWGSGSGNNGTPASGNNEGLASGNNWGTASGSNWELASGSNAMKYTICPYCNEEAIDGIITHKEGCPETCTCGREDGIHDEDCPLYEEAPETAAVYLIDKNGEYVQIDDHGFDTPLDIELYDGKTIYVQESENEQNIYFELYEDYLDVGDSNEEFGAYWSVNKETKAEVKEAGKLSEDTYRYATVTLDNRIQKGDVIELTAEHSDFENKMVTIEVVETFTGRTKITTVNGTSIKTSGNIPSNVKLEAAAFEIPAVYRTSLSRNSNEPKLAFAFDITLKNADGTVWQPAEGETVTVTLDADSLGLEYGTCVEISHDHGDELKNLGIHTVNDGRLFFETDGFSVFYGYIVDFEYNGYKFSMSGGEKIMLSDLLAALGIDRDIDTVTKVTFSDPSLIEIEREDGDWILTSLQSFGTEEWLHITFEDGTTIEIKVTDPILQYYLTGSDDWNMGTISVSVKKSGATNAMGDYTTNIESITPAVITQAANAIDLEDDVDLLIYARPGMAIRFASGITFPDGSWSLTDSNDGDYKYENWEWVWNGTDNYAILNSAESNKVANLRLTFATAVCNVRIITIPETSALPENVQPSKVKDTLDSGSDYKVVKLPVTLYNYDGKLFNEYNNNQTNGKWLAFHGVSMGESSHAGMTLPWTGTHLPNSGSISTGIMKDTLVNGLPKMTTTADTDLFSTEEYSGKEVEENVGFEYIYNNDTGYYTYSSNLNHAQFNKENKTIELYNQTLAPCLGDSQNSKAGFYPFVDINEAVLNYTASGHESWENNLTNDYFQQNAQFARDLVATGSISVTDENGKTTQKAASNVDMHFGLQLKADFYMPEGTQLDVNGDGTKEDIIYQFTGDDDLWVYIDDQLVLDLGGAHTAVSGKVNFTEKTVYIESYANVTASGNDFTLGETGSDETYSFEELGIEDIKEDQMHTLRIFYLERWSGESNCRMHFNLPIAPTGSVTVSKKLVNQDSQDLTVTPDTEYTFKIYCAEDDDDTLNATQFLPLENTEYSIVGGGNGVTDEGGEFTLKAGQSAQFSDIPRFAEVYVAEVKPNDGYIYTKTVVDGVEHKHDENQTEFKSNTKVMPNGSLSYSFTNYMKTQPLRVEKKVTSGLLNDDQQFEFWLDFTKNILETGIDEIDDVWKGADTITLTDNGSFNLARDESIILPRVPVNMTYTVKETNPDPENNSFDAPGVAATLSTYTQGTLPTEFAFDTQYGWTMADGGENKILVTNQQRFNLKISKSGIESVDHHVKTSEDADDAETQSTIYEVTGPNGFKLQVAICSNDSVTIKNLLVGNYNVKELTDWSWRYEVNNGTNIEVPVDPDEFNETVAYENTRNKIYWLSGDSYCKNWWGGESGAKVVRKDED